MKDASKVSGCGKVAVAGAAASINMEIIHLGTQQSKAKWMEEKHCPTPKQRKNWLKKELKACVAKTFGFVAELVV
jgi:hypothetical protein